MGQGHPEEGNTRLFFPPSSLFLTTPLPAFHTKTQPEAAHFALPKLISKDFDISLVVNRVGTAEKGRKKDREIEKEGVIYE